MTGRLLLLFLALAFAAPAVSQQYPARAVRIIVASSPGSGVDIVSRILAQKLSGGLGQQVVVDNRAGAGANLGAEIAARAPADGYTLLMGTPAHVINVSLYSGLNYDVVRDFTPVSLVSTGQYVVIVHPSVPARTAQQLIALGKANPGALAFGSAGPGNSTHLAGELFNSMAGVQMLHVPYKGSGPALVDLMSGQLQVMFANITAGLPHIRTQRVRALAVTGPKRTPQAPELPTVAEAALPGYSVTSFFGVLAPAGTPAGVVAKLNAEVVKATQSRDVQASLAQEGAEAVGSSPEEFAAYIRAEIPRWTAAVKTAGLQGQVK
ncbi:MAG TPA: tripartite tricarboxylate transporter substrate binding protein [Burkholderiales bacterium]|nr:tripartite tricarboxylate transporter substrate binding protein [Burkholderiales bacterium]